MCGAVGGGGGGEGTRITRRNLACKSEEGSRKQIFFPQPRLGKLSSAMPPSEVMIHESGAQRVSFLTHEAHFE